MMGESIDEGPDGPNLVGTRDAIGEKNDLSQRFRHIPADGLSSTMVGIDPDQITRSA
jgi:hypothetical protein